MQLKALKTMLMALLMAGAPTAAVADVEVEIDVKPRAINVTRNGIISVTLFGSDAFAVADVDVTTLAFGPAAPPAHAVQFKDKNNDGLTDLISQYSTLDTGIGSAGPVEVVCLRGMTSDGTAFVGCQEVRLVRRSCGIGFELAFLLPPLIWLRRRQRS